MPDPAARAVVVMPALALVATDDRLFSRALSRATVQCSPPAPDLLRVLRALDHPPPSCGLAALRLWGQSGRRPSAWVAAADPVFLEARMDHVHLHTIPVDTLPPADVDDLVDALQAALFDSAAPGLVQSGRAVYLHADEPLATASAPPELLSGERIDEHLPAGPDAARYLALSGEIQMCLHRHPVNERREADGLRPVNALWLWGGGTAPDCSELSLPVLYSNDPLMQGYWRSGTGRAFDFPDDPAAFGADTRGAFVATVPDTAAEPLRYLLHWRRLLAAGAIDRVTLLFRDGAEAELRAGDRWRVWRRRATAILGGAS